MVLALAGTFCIIAVLGTLNTGRNNGWVLVAGLMFIVLGIATGI